MHPTRNGRRAAPRPGPTGTAPRRRPQGRPAIRRPRRRGSPARRRTGPADAPPSRPRTLLRRLRLAAVAASALVLLVNGTAWGLYRDLTGGIVTTNVIATGSNSGPQDILLVGVDSRTDAQGNPLPQEVLEQLHTGGDNPRVLNSDTIILLHVPEGGGAAVAFSIPRDSYVDIPGYRQDKINAAYPAVQALTAERLVGDGVRDRARIDAESAEAGRTALIGAVERLTGVTVDHYAEINLLGFYNLTRAIGGVDVCLKNAVDEPLSGAHFPAGPSTVSGADALAFVRQRHGLPEGDLSRIRRQQVFLAAVADKVLAGGTLTDPAKLAGLVQVAQQSVVLDAGWDLLAFARQAPTSPRATWRSSPCRPRHREQRARQRRARRPGTGAHLRRAAHRRPGARRAPGPGGRGTAPTPEPPPPLTIEAPHYVVHVRNGSGSTGWPARCWTGSPLSGSSAGRWTTRPTPRGGWSATVTVTTRRRRSPSNSAGSRWSRTTPCRPGTCR